MDAIVATDYGMIPRERLRIELAPIVNGNEVQITVSYYEGDRLVRRSNPLAVIKLLKLGESENSFNSQLDYYEVGTHVRSTVIPDVFRGFSVSGGARLGNG